MICVEKKQSIWGQKPVPVPHCPPQIPWSCLGSKVGFHSAARLVTNRLSDGLAPLQYGVVDDGLVKFISMNISFTFTLGKKEN